MTQSVLGSLSLGYRPLWNKLRTLAGLQLFVHEDDQRVDGEHLLRTLGELWTAESPRLVLSVRSLPLLREIVSHADGSSPAIEVPVSALKDGALRAALASARQRGAHVVALGAPTELPDAEAARWFERRSLLLSASDAALALQAALRLRQDAAAGRVGGRSADSPIRPNSIVDGVASRTLAEHALDQQGAWAIAGWPSEDVLHRYRGQPLPIGRRTIVQVMNALDEEQSLDRVDQLISQEPTLVYRVMLYMNSPGLGLGSGVSTIRHGLMMLGYRKLNTWLAEQLPSASEDANLRPINAAMVLRGHLMAHLMEAGIEDDLRREIFACGFFSQLDQVMDEPLKLSFGRIPLPDRIVSATTAHTGPYASALLVAAALESPDPRLLRQLRVDHEMGAEEVNRALLRMLSAVAV